MDYFARFGTWQLGFPRSWLGMGNSRDGRLEAKAVSWCFCFRWAGGLSIRCVGDWRGFLARAEGFDQLLCGSWSVAFARVYFGSCGGSWAHMGSWVEIWWSGASVWAQPDVRLLKASLCSLFVVCFFWFDFWILSDPLLCFADFLGCFDPFFLWDVVWI